MRFKIIKLLLTKDEYRVLKFSMDYAWHRATMHKKTPVRNKRSMINYIRKNLR